MRRLWQDDTHGSKLGSCLWHEGSAASGSRSNVACTGRRGAHWPTMHAAGAQSKRRATDCAPARLTSSASAVACLAWEADSALCSAAALAALLPTVSKTLLLAGRNSCTSGRRSLPYPPHGPTQPLQVSRCISTATNASVQCRRCHTAPALLVHSPAMPLAGDHCLPVNMPSPYYLLVK